MSNEKWSEWIDWSGGECPLPDGIDHEVRKRYGDTMPDDSPETWDWSHHGEAVDIIAYRYRITDDSTMTEEEAEIPAEEWGEHSSWAGSVPDGQKYDSDKPAMDLIPPYMEEEVGMVLAFGAQKYAPDNWRKVTPLRSRYLAAAQRHINALKKGEQMDPESGLHHAAHAVCCLMFLGEVELETS